MNLNDLKKINSIPFVYHIFFLDWTYLLDELEQSGDETREAFAQWGIDIDSIIPEEDRFGHKADSFYEDIIYIYQVVQNLYGYPTIRSDEADNKYTRAIQGIYVLTLENIIVTIKFMTMGNVSLCIIDEVGERESVEKHFKQFVQKLKGEVNKLKNLTKNKPRHEQPTNNLLSAIYFENSFHYYFEEGRTILDKLEQENNEDNNPSYLPRVSSFFLFVASFEGFVNLLYELYLWQDIRENERITKYIQKAPIMVKLQLAPTYCSCFKGRVIKSNEVFKKMQAVFDLRNNLIHANMTSAMKISTYEIDDMVFYSHDFSKNKYDLPKSARRLQLKHLNFVCEAVEKMVDHTLSLMNSEQYQELSKVIHQRSFLAHIVDGQYKIQSENQ